MSYLPVDQETNTQGPTGQTTNNPGQTTGQPPPQTGGSTGSAPGGPAAVGSASGSPTQFGSSASKLGDYLTANAPQITQQADTLAGNLNTQYGNLSSGITNAANQFGQQVQGGYAANNPDVVNQAVSDPTKFASDPNNVKAFQGQYNDTYTGPTNFEGTSGYSDLQNQVGQGVTQGQLLNSPAGLKTYLQGQGTNPTQASSTLDALLMQGNPDAQAKIQQASGQFGNLTGQLATATTGADQGITAAQAAAQQAQQYAQGQFNPAAQQFNQSLNSGLTAKNAADSAYNKNLNAYQTTLNPIFQQANTLGTAAGANFSGITNPYATQTQITNPATLANYATPEQYAEAQALGQLGGTGYVSPLDQANIGQAGTATATPTLSNMTPSGLAQQYANNLYQAATSTTPGAVGMPGSAQYNLLQYLQGINPNSVTTEGAMTAPNAEFPQGVANLFAGGDKPVYNAVGT